MVLIMIAIGVASFTLGWVGKRVTDQIFGDKT